MLKKSMVIVSIIILSCIYMVSCKFSSRSGNDSNLTELPINAPQEIKDYVKAVRVVAQSTKNTCQDNSDKSVIAIGKKNTVDENSYKDGRNFVEINSSNDVKISLYNDCMDYDVTLAYFCKLNSKLKINEEQLCFKGTANTSKGKQEGNTLQLTISLKPQGEWIGKITDKVETKPQETSVTLASFFNDNCFIKNGEKYESYTTGGIVYPLFSKECTYESTKNDTFSYNVLEDTYDFQSPFDGNGEKSFQDSIKYLTKGNNMLEIVTIDGKDQKISTPASLKTVLETQITSGFKINIITVPTNYIENDNFNRKTVEFTK